MLYSRYLIFAYFHAHFSNTYGMSVCVCVCAYMLLLHVLKHCMGNSQLSHVAYEAMAIATMQQQQSASQSPLESQSQSQKLMQKQVNQSSSCSGEWDKTIYHVCNSHEKFMQIERSMGSRLNKKW